MKRFSPRLPTNGCTLLPENQIERGSLVKTLGLTIAILLGPACFGQSKPAVPAKADQPSCLIVKHASTARQFFVSGANWQYVAGDFPKGMKWKSNITDRNIRKVKELGGQVVVIKPDYNAEDLAQAQKTCGLNEAAKSSNTK
jgi:hypothetical protein